MEQSRLQAYLQSACSVLGFSVGEIWCCNDTKGALVMRGDILTGQGSILRSSSQPS